MYSAARKGAQFMPEQDKERTLLPGETTVTPSSDAAIRAVIAQLASERAGLPNPLVVIDLPFATSVVNNNGSLSADPKVPGKIIDLEKIRGLKAADSRLGQTLRNERMDKKAA